MARRPQGEHSSPSKAGELAYSSYSVGPGTGGGCSLSLERRFRIAAAYSRVVAPIDKPNICGYHARRAILAHDGEHYRDPHFSTPYPTPPHTRTAVGRIRTSSGPHRGLCISTIVLLPRASRRTAARKSRIRLIWLGYATTESARVIQPYAGGRADPPDGKGALPC